MQPSARFRHSRHISSAPLQQWTASSHYNCGIASPPRWEYFKHAAPVTNWSIKIGIQGHPWPLRLEPLSSCLSRVQGSHLQVSRIQRFLGKPRHHAWYVGPSLDHYQCNHFFVPKMWANRISGSAELFPQHCQVPFFYVERAFARSDQWVSDNNPRNVARETGISQVNCKLAATQPFDTNQTLTSPVHEWLWPPGDIQRLPQTSPPEQRVEQRVKQRVDVPTLTITMPIALITNAPAIMRAPNPTTKQALKSTPRMHSCCTRNNIPGSVPPIVQTQNRRPIPTTPMPVMPSTPLRRPTRFGLKASPIVPTRIQRVRLVPIEGGVRQRNIISQEAINFLTECIWAHSPDIFTPNKFQPKSAPLCMDFAQVTIPIVHPTMGKTISSY